MAFSVVERPEPLRPSRLTTSPRRTSKRHAAQHVALAVVGVQVLDPQQQVGSAHAATSSPR